MVRWGGGVIDRCKLARPNMIDAGDISAYISFVHNTSGSRWARGDAP